MKVSLHLVHDVKNFVRTLIANDVKDSWKPSISYQIALCHVDFRHHTFDLELLRKRNW